MNAKTPSSLTIGMSRYFRFLELTVVAMLFTVAVGMISATRMSLAVSVMGTYFGSALPLIFAFEACALLCEWQFPDRQFQRGTVLFTAFWTLAIILFNFVNLTELRDSFKTYDRHPEWIEWRLSELLSTGWVDHLANSLKWLIMWGLPIGVVGGILRMRRQWVAGETRAALLLWQSTIVVFLTWNVVVSFITGIPVSRGKMVWWFERVLSPGNIGFGYMDEIVWLIAMALVFTMIAVLVVEGARTFGAGRIRLGFAVSFVISNLLLFLPTMSRRSAIAETINTNRWLIRSYKTKFISLIGSRVWVAYAVLIGGAIVAAGAMWLWNRWKNPSGQGEGIGATKATVIRKTT